MARLGPWRRDLTLPLNLLQSELNRIFDEYWDPSRGASSQARPMDLDPAAWAPPADLFETSDAFLLNVEVPGVEPATINLSLTGTVLTIRGEKPLPEATSGEAASPLQERLFGPFHRQFTLPGEVDFEATQAEARHGVLTIRLPKREAARPRSIPVQAT